MEFHEKLQELRKRQGLTQEELARELFVSRTAVSKWESGRGYPNIDSLKELARFFSVTVDELLTGEEVLNIAEEDHKETENRLRDLVFGSLDCSSVLLLLLPVFGQVINEVVYEVTLQELSDVAVYIKLAYYVQVIGTVLIGLLYFLLGKTNTAFWEKYKYRISMIWNVVGVFLFIISPQPYAAAFLFVYLSIKALMLLKSR